MCLMQKDPWKDMLLLAAINNCHQKSDMLKLSICVSPSMDQSACAYEWGMGTSWRQEQKIKPKIQKFGWKIFWPAFFSVFGVMNCGWTIPFHTTCILHPSCDQCAWYPISAARSLLGRRNPFDLLGLAHCRVLQLTTPQELYCQVFVWLDNMKGKMWYMPLPCLFLGMLFGEFWPQNVTWGIQSIKAGLTQEIGFEIFKNCCSESF